MPEKTPIRAYWRRIHQRAFGEAIKMLGLDSKGQIVIKAVIAIVVLLGLLFVGSKDASTDEIVVRIGIVVAIGLLLIAIYAWKFIAAPAEMERESSQVANAKIDELSGRVQNLEAEPEQLLAFDFRPEDNKYFEQVKVARNLTGVEKHLSVFDYDVYSIGRVAVKNLSETESLPEVRTDLINHRYNGKPYKTLNIRLASYASGLQVESVPPRQSVTYDLFRVYISDRKLCLDFGPDKNGQYRSMPLGSYVLKITASSTLSGLRHLPKNFLLMVGENGEIDYGPEGASESGRIIRKLDLTDLT